MDSKKQWRPTLRMARRIRHWGKAAVLVAAVLMATLVPGAAFADSANESPDAQPQSAPDEHSSKHVSGEDESGEAGEDSQPQTAHAQAASSDRSDSAFDTDDSPDDAYEARPRVTRERRPVVPSDAEKAERVEPAPVDPGCDDENGVARTGGHESLLSGDPCAGGGDGTDTGGVPTGRAPMRRAPNYSGDLMDRLCAGRGGPSVDAPAQHDDPRGGGGGGGEGDTAESEGEDDHPHHLIEPASEGIADIINEGFDGEEDGVGTKIVRVITTPVWVPVIVLGAFAIDEIRSFPLILHPWWEPDAGDDGTRGADADASLEEMCARYRAQRGGVDVRQGEQEPTNTPCDDPVADPEPAFDVSPDAEVPDCEDDERGGAELSLDDTEDARACDEASPCDTRPDERLGRTRWATGFGGSTGAAPCDPRICNPGH